MYDVRHWIVATVCVFSVWLFIQGVAQADSCTGPDACIGNTGTLAVSRKGGSAAWPWLSSPFAAVALFTFFTFTGMSEALGVEPDAARRVFLSTAN